MALQTYRRKRNFSVTPEPAGGGKGQSRYRFVIQKHAARRLHYDLRLELDGAMKSWAVTRGPSLVPGEKRLAIHVEDHPIEYNKFEGNIPKGEYGGGSVLIWDRGRWIPDGDPHRGYAKGHLSFQLEGEKLSGGWHLVRMRQRKGERQEPWLLIKVNDDASRTAAEPDILEEKPRSVVTGRSIAEIAEGKSPIRRKTRKKASKKPAQRAPQRRARSRSKRTSRKSTTKKRSKKASSAKRTLPTARAGATAALPDFIPPCLATLRDKPPSGPNWAHEIKVDGYRIQGRLNEGKVTLLTRKGLDWTEKFQPIAKAIAKLPARKALLDGEVIVEGAGGVSSFPDMQADLSAGRSDRFTYLAFDLLHLDGRDLTSSPLRERRKALEAVLSGLDKNDKVRLSEQFEEDGAVLLKHACRLNLEGIISKQTNAPYRPGRHDDWIKTKCADRQEFVVAGFGPSTVLKRAVGSLVLAYYENGGLRYAGRVGTGFTQASSKELWRRLDPLRIKGPPFDKIPDEERRRPVQWVKPDIVVEIDFRGWTADRLLRHPAFKGVREDKAGKEVVREMPKDAKARGAIKAPRVAGNSRKVASRKVAASNSAVRLTHPDRVYWKDVGVTKQALADFYTEIWDWIEPHLVGRPFALLRCPDGASGQCFFQKHASAGIEAKRFVKVPDRDNKDFLAIDNLDGLIALVQAGVLEIHVWGSTVDDIDSCNRIVFDLDPGPKVEWARVIDAAREVRERLKALDLECFVKTTGGKGLHVVLPIVGVDWDRAKSFAHSIARAMASDSPHRYTANMAKHTRTGRIFVDYLRNGRGATAVVAYSTRARPGAPVSTPVRWEELSPQLTADRFTVLNLRKRLAKLRRDPWAGMGRLKQNLAKAGSAR